MTVPRCDSCAYWRLSDDPAKSGEIWDADDKQGACHRHAPRPWNGEPVYQVLKHLTTLSYDAMTIGGPEPDELKMIDEQFAGWEAAAFEPSLTSWPGTTGSDWCGEFKLRSEADVSP